MLTITIIFALLVALWGFSGAIVTYAKRSLSQAKPRPRSRAHRSGSARPPPVAFPAARQTPSPIPAARGLAARRHAQRGRRRAICAASPRDGRAAPSRC